LLDNDIQGFAQTDQGYVVKNEYEIDFASPFKHCAFIAFFS